MTICRYNGKVRSDLTQEIQLLFIFRVFVALAAFIISAQTGNQGIERAGKTCSKGSQAGAEPVTAAGLQPLYMSALTTELLFQGNHYIFWLCPHAQKVCI